MTDLSLRYLLFGEDKTASSTIGKVGGAFHKLGSQIGGEFGEIIDKVGDGIDNIGEHAHSMSAKITGVGAVIGGVGVALQLAGSKEKQGSEQLNAAINATGKSADDYKESIEGAIKSNETFGFGASDTQQALAKLTAATNDPDKALKAMGVTANLAASQHISLADASKVVARVMSGTGGRVLAQYGIQMDTTKSKTAAGQAALVQLSQKLDGQASASVDSFGGKIRVAQTRIGDWTAQIGQKLGPALTVAGPAIMGVGTILEIYTARQAAAAVATEAETVAEGQSVIGRAASAVATGAAAVATGIWTAAQWALNTALSANPIALIIIGIVALIAILVVAYKESSTFRAIVTGAFHDVTGAATATFGWIKAHWPLLLAILTGPVGLAVLAIVKNWGKITTFFKGVPKALGSAMSTVASALTSPFKTAFNAIASIWNDTVGALSFHLPSWIPGIGGDGFSMPKIPMLARGGILTKPTLVMAGEAGDEAIVPLSAGRDRGGFGGQPIHIQINFNGPVDKAAVGKQVVESIVEFQRQQGGRPLPISVTG